MRREDMHMEKCGEKGIKYFGDGVTEIDMYPSTEQRDLVFNSRVVKHTARKAARDTIKKSKEKKGGKK